ncbi:MAG: hypothetical protein Q8L14_40765 [Myxococcales bacterium]|nr:hypothetical protein [Myxococcales bacterium]
MTSAWLVMAIAATGPVKVAAPGLAGVSVTPELQAFVNDHLAQELVLEGLDVIPSSQIASVLGLERQKQLLGCADSQCVVELANALGVDAILLGTVAKLDTVIQLDVRLVSATDARALAIYSERVTSEAGLLDAMTRAAKSLGPEVAKKLGKTATPSARAGSASMTPLVRTEERNKPLRNVGKWSMIGGAIVAVGSFIGLLAIVDTNAPSNTPLTPTEAGLVTVMLAGVGVAAIGLLLYVVGGTERVPVQVGFMPTRDGGLFTLGASY